MKPKHLIVFAALLLFSGCWTANYLEYNFTLNEAQTVYVGEPIFRAVVGKTNRDLSFLDPRFITDLIYLGKSGNTVKIGYVEYANIESRTYIRPDYSRILEYDLTQSDTIGYNLTRIKVLGATNTEINYKVLSCGALGYMADTLAYKDYIILQRPTSRK
ncbi:MAG: hypothetical protein HUU43_14185 [Ignavibacteriaceae bacterium]|nr:hypothetical protein [Ignavibacteriaceae bacterium]